MIPCELELTYTPFCDITILAYEIELPPDGKKIGFNLLDNEDFTIPYVTDTIPNSPAGPQLTTQVKKNVCIIYINREVSIIYQGALGELNHHQTPRDKSKVKISLCRRKRYQKTDLEEGFQDLIKSYPWFHILKLVSQRNLSPQRALVKL